MMTRLCTVALTFQFVIFDTETGKHYPSGHESLKEGGGGRGLVHSPDEWSHAVHVGDLQSKHMPH